MLLTIFSLIQGRSFAQTYPAYLCGSTTTAKLRATATTVAGDQLLWEKVTNSGATFTTVKTGSHTDKDYDTPSAATLGVGEHVYRVTTITNGCPSDASLEYKIFVLPESKVTLAAPTTATWCENVTTSSDLVATAEPIVGSLPTGVEYNFNWTITKSSVAVTTAGSAVDAATTSTYTINTNIVGTYDILATATYKLPSGSVLVTSGTAGCPVSTSIQQITVKPQPTQPSISIVQ